MTDQTALCVNSVKFKLVDRILGWESLFIVFFLSKRTSYHFFHPRWVVFESEKMQNHNPSDKISR